ncbi:hypothetical protein SADUNF_Sadunf04G0062600 [Salix dunnii]|uniref:Uncharacterized protein n=1 Tax=Salix dunnii TaxID=1413687 RepID=A0A835KAF5_9ROSI|nr:hypothetical protein SADUNF_Sadunf04G0062600 [Salix dunnii]
MGVLGLGDLKESLWSVWVLRIKESGGLRRIGGIEVKIEGKYKRRVDIEAILCGNESTSVCAVKFLQSKQQWQQAAAAYMPLLHPPLSFLLQERIFFLLVYKMCVVRLRPCIDMHKGKVKQIVGSTLRDLKGEGDSALVTNFESDETAAEFANLHKEDGFMGGADDLSKSIAIEELFDTPLHRTKMILFDLFCCLLVFVLAEKKELCFAEDIPDLLAQLGKFANRVTLILSLAMVKQTIERLKDLVRVAGKQKLV